MSEEVLNVGENATKEKSFVVGRATDPVVLPQPYVTPTDFAAQWPTPLDPTEFIAMCEEVTLLSAIPEERTQLKQHTWRELSSLAFVSGSSYVAFADGACPEEFTHDGANTTVTLKNLGAKKSLSQSDILHSMAVSAAGWNGINQLIGGYASGEGVPGGSSVATILRESIMGAKEKEIALASALVLNNEDRLLVAGNHVNNSLEFTGIEQWATNYSCTMHDNSATATGTYSASGTFSAGTFDAFLAESCAKPTHIFGHPASIQEMLSGYFQLGFAGSQVVNFADGGRITPGFNFAGFVNTGVGRLAVVADNHFRRNATGGTTFQADLWALRMTHNGEPLVYRMTQIPFGLTDLVPGCTAISFQVWKKTALIIKGCCAQTKFSTQFNGRIVTTCTSLG